MISVSTIAPRLRNREKFVSEVRWSILYGGDFNIWTHERCDDPFDDSFDDPFDDHKTLISCFCLKIRKGNDFTIKFWFAINVLWLMINVSKSL